MTVKESKVDVLIVGAGPAGHMAATWFARTGVKARIIDKRSEVQFVGQADGLQSRTLEVFQSFGFGDRAIKESNQMLEMAFWEPDADGRIFRSQRLPDSTPNVSRFAQTVLHQGRVEQWFRDHWAKYSGGSDAEIKLERPVQANRLEIDESVDPYDTEAYPVTVEVDHLDEADGMVAQYGGKIANGLFRAFDGDGNERKAGQKEVIHCKYVIGCDGAHSWVRKSLGYSMVGESTDYVWGVLDGVPVTDFPDIRSRCAIHSASNGSIMVIPREHNMVRLYIQLQKTPRDPSTETASEQSEQNGNGQSAAAKANRIDRSKITPELILDSAAKIFHPYKIDMVDLKWYTAYQIGQRTATNFEKNLRVFIAGDACHTHSPKAGQGMNVSMMDTYNLGWKIALVVRGFAHPRILETYEPERRRVAQNLISYDYKLSRLFSGKPGAGGVDLEEFQRYFEKGAEFASGCNVDYKQSPLVSRPAVKVAEDDFEDPVYASDLAKHVPIGRRLDTAQVMCHSDTRPWELVDRLPSDGRFRILYFSGDIKGNKRLYDFMREFGDYLESDKSVIRRFTPAEGYIDSLIDVLLIYASKRTSVEWDEFPSAFRPRDFKGRMNYFKIFADDETYHQGHGQAYKKYGIRPGQGCFVVVRPDGYVGAVEPLCQAGIENMEKYFENFLVKPKLSWVQNGGYKDTGRDEGEWYGKGEYGYPVLGYGGPLLAQ